MKRIIGNLDRRWISAASGQLCTQLSNFMERGIDREITHILAFLAHFPGEIDLSEFLAYQLDKREVYLPRTEGNLGMSFVQIGKDWAAELEEGSFGIPEPQADQGKIYDIQHASNTAVIVPGLAFDADGNRLSRDPGHYDVFLRKGKMIDALKVGVCWSIQLLPEVPSDSHHIMMDCVCHERGYQLTARRFEEDF